MRCAAISGARRSKDNAAIRSASAARDTQYCGTHLDLVVQPARLSSGISARATASSAEHIVGKGMSCAVLISPRILTR